MRNVAKGIRVDARVGALFEKVGIAGVFALGEKGAPEPPDGRIKPVEDTHKVSESGQPEVSTLDVAEFVAEGHLQSVG